MSYCRDVFGRKVLVGLTYAETREFELINAEPPVDERGEPLAWETDETSFPSNQARWLELFRKHRAACAQQPPG